MPKKGKRAGRQPRAARSGSANGSRGASPSARSASPMTKSGSGSGKVFFDGAGDDSNREANINSRGTTTEGVLSAAAKKLTPPPAPLSKPLAPLAVNGEARSPVKAVTSPRAGVPPRSTASRRGDEGDTSLSQAQSTLPGPVMANKTILSAAEIGLASLLVDAQQTHLVENWPLPGTDDAQKHAFLAQLGKLHDTVPGEGGVVGYASRARSLLADAQEGRNPLEGWTPSVPQGASLDPGSDRYLELEKEGLKSVKECGFVLVAGGLGERLGYGDIKLKLPTQSCTSMCYLELYIRQILALQARYGAGKKLPLAIMVSDDTEASTLKLLEENSFFGMPKEQLTLMKQEKVPAIAGNSGTFAAETEDPYHITTKPHGHGDVHSLMHRSGTADKWAQAGQKWVIFMQDTNGLALHTLPAALGVSKQLGLEVNSMTIPRKAKQAVGGIAKLTHDDGRMMTINVEYNQLDPLLRGTTSPDGDVNDAETGYSPFPGNINQLIFALQPYCAVLQESGGVLAEFVNPKYTDETRQTFKKPTRLECMMQDYPKALGPDAKVGFTSLPPWVCFSPVKNSLEDALKAQKAGIAPGAAATGESDAFMVWTKLLTKLGCSVSVGPSIECLGGLNACLSPMIALEPDFAICYADLQSRFPLPGRVKVSGRSTLVVKGAGVVIEDLDLDGCLEIEVEKGGSLTIRRLSVSNRGWSMQALSEAEAEAGSEELRMRGFKLVKSESRKISVKAGETKVIDESPGGKDDKDVNCFAGILSMLGL